MVRHVSSSGGVYMVAHDASWTWRVRAPRARDPADETRFVSLAPAPTESSIHSSQYSTRVREISPRNIPFGAPATSPGRGPGAVEIFVPLDADYSRSDLMTPLALASAGTFLACITTCMHSTIMHFSNLNHTRVGPKWLIYLNVNVDCPRARRSK
ncbi:hypothetical protein EVAR_67234_1 [Eumeta japonica]|uniref:Uncharacterized protein n=1 Tax=Eumeta variegata TaxID=151549 RepID=A0A4C1YTG5_EUMVA|nr:hypothetical protein EVAR_67234_1 [Eumeta japonica]